MVDRRVEIRSCGVVHDVESVGHEKVGSKRLTLYLNYGRDGYIALWRTLGLLPLGDVRAGVPYQSYCITY
jgi:hypothetical protein